MNNFNKFLLTFVFCMPAFCLAAQQNAPDIELDEMSLIGSAEFRYLFWKVYRAELYADQDDFQYFDVPLALDLSYLRAFTKAQLLSETEKQFMAMGLQEDDYRQWLIQLGTIFPNVEMGDSILLYIDEQSSSHFYFNNVFQGSISDPGFSRQFSAIWLDREDRHADFSRRLRGEVDE